MRKSLLLSGIILGSLLSNGVAVMTPIPVVVELFESQGCSSCPPSERVMADLKKKFGESVLLLTFHVDYWDSLGWKDTFSDALFTERQREYAQSLGQRSMYTPEIVVAGQTGFVGSDGDRAAKEVQRAIAATAMLPKVTLRWADPHELDFSVRGIDERTKRFSFTAVIVVDASSVRVLRGENTGVTMSGDHTVRALVRLPAAVAGETHVTIRFPWTRGQDRWSATVLMKDEQGRLMATLPEDLPPLPT